MQKFQRLPATNVDKFGNPWSHEHMVQIEGSCGGLTPSRETLTSSKVTVKKTRGGRSLTLLSGKEPVWG